MARTKPAPALRGVELVERVIARVEREGQLRPKPVPTEALARLRLPGRRALPASLRRWLAFDGSYLGVIARGRPPKLDTRPFVSICRDELSDHEEAWDDFADLAPADAWLLPGGTDSRRMLYLGSPDELGEYPVLVADSDDVPMVGVYSPGFDVWLAEEFDALEGWERDDYSSMCAHPTYGAASLEQAKRNLGGYTWVELGGHGERVPGARAPRAVTKVASRPAAKKPAKAASRPPAKVPRAGRRAKAV